MDFTETAQRSPAYPDYARQLAGMAAEDLVYLGLALYGPKKPINRLTGNLRLLRDPVTPGIEQAMDSRHF